MKLLLLLTITLLSYTQATEEKKCLIKEYVLTENKGTYSESHNACQNLEGEIASEDLKDSENSKKAEAAVENFRETDNLSMIWLGITVGDMDENPHETKNPFVFSDGTEIDESNFMYKWENGGASGDHPYINSEGKNRCSVIFNMRGEIMQSHICDGATSGYGLCKKYENCKDENSASSESERSRANLPVFALFVACSVFKTLYALVGVAF